MKANIDDIAAKLPKLVTGLSKKSRPKVYDQSMRSLRGYKTFTLRTSYITGAGTKISLYEDTHGLWKLIGNRWVSPEPESIQKAIKSLERKAKCKLYYVLLISTDGEYL